MIPISSLLNPEPVQPEPPPTSQTIHTPLQFTPQDHLLNAIYYNQMGKHVLASWFAAVGYNDSTAAPDVRIGLCLEASSAFHRIGYPKWAISYAQAGLAQHPPELAVIGCFHLNIARSLLALGYKAPALESALTAKEALKNGDSSMNGTVDALIHHLQSLPPAAQKPHPTIQTWTFTTRSQWK